jgi:TolB-like protein
MASIIEGYSYDIFISYRQKDNKYDGWVTEFVDNLKRELAATFKEEISVYFDLNAYDGLLETHDVDASLKEKLKCLVFLPIISRTYCDLKSFAWEHEFKAFVEQASQDQFGLKIRLPNGNVASRVLPICIHDLDIKDNQEYESVLGGALRGVEFIYKSSGVNRPLRSKEDNPNDNLNKTFYRDQINKVALAIKEIILGFKKEPIEYIGLKKEVISTIEKPALQEKSIIVLPFENISPDPDQEYFSDGITEEIITDLSYIPDLLVISRNSAMTFKDSKKKTGEIANEMNVRYVLEGSVRKAGKNLRITAQLIDGTNDSHLWAEKYTGTLDDIFEIQERVSQSIANTLKIRLGSQEKLKIQERSIDNVIAYDYYLRACREIRTFSKERMENGLNFLLKGIDIIGENAMIYAAIAYVYFQLVNIGIEQEENIKKAEEFAAKALNIDPESAEAHLVLANLDTLNGNLHKAILHINRAHINKPDDPEIMQWLCVILFLVGKTETAISMVDKCIKIDPTNSMYYGLKGSLLFFQGHFDLSLDVILKVYKIFPENGMMQFWKSLVLIYNNRLDDCYEFINESVLEPGQDIMAQLTIFLKYVIKGSRDKYTSLLTPDFLNATQMDCQLSSHMAAFYSYIGEKDKSLEWLENAVDRGFINYPFLNEYDKLLNNVRGEERFKKLMERVKYEWETFKL